MKNRSFLIIAFLLAAVDQMIKSAIRLTPPGSSVCRIDGILEIRHSTNTGAAFSLLSERTLLITLLSAALLVAVYLIAAKTMRLTAPAKAAFACLIGGGVGNLIDRLLFSAVTDYIRLLFFRFPVFNLADILITCSIAFLMILVMTGKHEVPTGEDHGSNH